VQIEEIKRHLDGRVERHSLRLVLHRPHLIVALYEFARGLRTDGFAFPRGSYTYGFFWKRRPYVMYRMLGPQGQLVANRFDVVEDVRLGEREVSYRDLLLDIWIDASGVVQVADEDGVAGARREGTLSNAQLGRIDRTRGLLLRRHRVITTEALRMLP
jgi:Protein of unknown function (DUF402)